MTIIFDFNRTLYEPDTGKLFEGALELLSEFAAKGHVLYLVSKYEPERSRTLSDLGIAHFFAHVAFVEEKGSEIARIVREAGEEVYLVGDHLHVDVREGNRHGARTIWLKRGKFSELSPETKDDYPWRTIEDLKEVRALLT